MKKYLNLISLVILSVLVFACSDDEGGTDNPQTPFDTNVTYRVTFNSNFTAQTHPNNYPPNAMFSQMFVAAHPENEPIFETGTMASAGFKIFTETGATEAFRSEVEDFEEGEPQPIVNTSIGAANGPVDSNAVTISVTPATTFITFLARISPSPDWFVSIEPINVLGQSSLIDRIEVEVFAYDAGTDSGANYTSEDMTSDPQENITFFIGEPFTEDSPLAESVPLGTLVLELVE